MNFNEIKNSVQYLKDSMECLDCHGKYHDPDISLIASTNIEGLFELKCCNCSSITIANVIIEPEMEITRKKRKNKTSLVSENDILDVKNFLSRFDGDFKKIFKS